MAEKLGLAGVEAVVAPEVAVAGDGLDEEGEGVGHGDGNRAVARSTLSGGGVQAGCFISRNSVFCGVFTGKMGMRAHIIYNIMYVFR